MGCYVRVWTRSYSFFHWSKPCSGTSPTSRLTILWSLSRHYLDELNTARNVWNKWLVPEEDDRWPSIQCSKPCSQAIAFPQCPLYLSYPKSEISRTYADDRIIVPREYLVELHASALQYEGSLQLNQTSTWHLQSEVTGRSDKQYRKQESARTKLGWRTCVECKKLILQPSSKWASAPPSCHRKYWGSGILEKSHKYKYLGKTTEHLNFYLG
jgi:hypothetical protein